MTTDTDLLPEDATLSSRSDIRALRHDVNDLISSRSRTVRIVTSVVGSAMVIGLIPLVSTLVGIGEVREQQRAMRADVSEVLTLARSLERTDIQTRGLVAESVRDRAAIHEELRTVETKIWEAAQRQRAMERNQ